MGLNEYSVLMNLLTRTGKPIGADVEDMLDALGYPELEGRAVLFGRLAALHNLLEPLGLSIKFNPIDRVFYIDVQPTKDMDIAQEVLPDRLAATLLAVMTLAYQKGGWVSVKQVQGIRKKSLRSIREDLRDLAKSGYIEFDRNSGDVRPGVRVPFEIDYEEIFKNLVVRDT
ncbi:MAG: hypothetical protein K9W43_06270 [Candidatus Thorarchaeota archaeon]|nr:hypothetical protein [Candidatus Thorarchaeota archaeon]